MRAAELLLELGDAPVEYKVTEKTPDICVVEAPDIGLKLFMSRVIEKGMDDVQIEFSVHGRYDLAKSGNAIKVFTTVKSIFETTLIDFIAPTDELVEFAADRVEPSRVSLYRRMVPEISKILGPTWEFVDEDMGHSIRIYRWKRVRDRIVETGDRPASFDVVEHSHNSMRIESPEIKLALSLIRTGHNVKNPDMVHISFSVDNSVHITGTGNAIKIFSTVQAMLKRYLNMFIELDDKRVNFIASRDEGSRIRLYVKMVPEISKILGRNWKYVDDDDTHSAAKFYNWVRRSQLREKKVQSTWITDLTYNRPNKVLTMKLSNGTSYSIPGITRATFDQWTKTPSKGQFFHDRIKDKFKINKI